MLAVNKMDLVGFDERVFRAIVESAPDVLDGAHLEAIPMSALHGDNVIDPSDRTPWYDGPALLPFLEEVYIAGDRNLVDVRFPVQYVIRPQTHEHRDHRSYAGTVASGVMRPGDEVIVPPIGKTTRIAAIEGPNGPVAEAFPPMAVVGEPGRRHRHLAWRHDRPHQQPAQGRAGLRRDRVLDGAMRPRWSPAATTSSSTPPGPPAHG